MVQWSGHVQYTLQFMTLDFRGKVGAIKTRGSAGISLADEIAGIKKDWPHRVFIEQTTENKSWAHQYSWRWLSKRISQGRERSERSGGSKQKKPPRQHGRLQAGLEFTWTKEMLNRMANTEEANQGLKSSCFPCKDVNGRDHVGAALGRWWDAAVLNL